MKCLLDKEREVGFPCSKNCHLFGDCICEFQKEMASNTANPTEKGGVE